ncbi:MAG: alpha/beta hydrolase [Chloroflexi bacterium]|nr:alpha/beta hydrolase [Chloroflexota bacterium]
MCWFEDSGSRIYYEEHGTGEPALVMPGFTEGVDELDMLVAALSARYHVIAAELPGSGSSEPQPRDYTPHFYREDAARMAALLEHLNSGPAHILGFSDGGEVALLMAIDHPEQVRSLVVWGAAGTLGSGDLAPMIDAIGNIVDTPPPNAYGWSNYLKERYGDDVARATTRSWARASRAILDAGGDISLSRAGEINCPVLIIHGEYDPFCTRDMARELASRIPHAQGIEVADAGHPVHSDRPDWFNKVALDWLSVT